MAVLAAETVAPDSVAELVALAVDPAAACCWRRHGQPRCFAVPVAQGDDRGGGSGAREPAGARDTAARSPHPRRYPLFRRTGWAIRFLRRRWQMRPWRSASSPCCCRRVLDLPPAAPGAGSGAGTPASAGAACARRGRISRCRRGGVASGRRRPRCPWKTRQTRA